MFAVQTWGVFFLFVFNNILRPIFVIKDIVFTVYHSSSFMLKRAFFLILVLSAGAFDIFIKSFFVIPPPMKFTSRGFFVNGFSAFPSIPFNARAGVSAFVIKA